MEILILKELIGRTITNATMWSDRTSMSLQLDNGGILQITPHEGSAEATLTYEVEFAPDTSLMFMVDGK